MSTRTTRGGRGCGRSGASARGGFGLLAVGLGVGLGRFGGMVGGVVEMTLRDMGMMRGGVVITGRMVRSSQTMMLCGELVVFGSFFVMFNGLL